MDGTRPSIPGGTLLCWRYDKRGDTKTHASWVPYKQRLVVPVSLTWPMGFAWSSYVAQEFLLDLCNSAAFRSTKFYLAKPLPQCPLSLFLQQQLMT